MSATGTQDCPARNLNIYIKSAFSSRVNDNAFLFQTSNPTHYVTGNPLSYDLARKIIHNALFTIRENYQNFSTHSLRSGGCTAAVLAGCSERLIMLQGRWKSANVKDRYVEESLNARLNVSKAISTACK